MEKYITKLDIMKSSLNFNKKIITFNIQGFHYDTGAYLTEPSEGLVARLCHRGSGDTSITGCIAVNGK